MKKLLAFVLACGMVFASVSVTAQGTYIEGILKDKTLTVTHTEGDKAVATVMMYEEGKLSGTKTARLTDGVYTFNLTDFDKDMRIFFYGEKAYDLKITTPEPEATPAPKPVKTPYPEVYEKPLDAINAPAVVRDVALVSIDGELFYELKVWYQGRELVTNVRDKVTIRTAPPVMAHLVGEKVGCLKAGDVVHLTADLQGRLKSVEFIYRPDFEAYYENDISTSGMIGTDNYSTYHFGVAVGTYKNAMELADSNGHITDLDVSRDAFVYAVTKTRKGANVILEGTGALTVDEAYIPKENITDNVIDWSDAEELSYVLVRETKGVVTDMIVFR